MSRTGGGASSAPLAVECTNTILYCREWRATVRFYRDQLALPVTLENAWFVEFRVAGESYLSIADASRATIHAVAGQGVTLSWRVPNLERARQFLTQRGIVITPVQSKWGARLFYCHDPEGHRIEFWSPDEATP